MVNSPGRSVISQCNLPLKTCSGNDMDVQIYDDDDELCTMSIMFQFIQSFHFETTCIFYSLFVTKCTHINVYIYIIVGKSYVNPKYIQINNIQCKLRAINKSVKMSNSVLP